VNVFVGVDLDSYYIPQTDILDTLPWNNHHRAKMRERKERTLEKKKKCE
jgi:hypothetical protein